MGQLDKKAIEFRQYVEKVEDEIGEIERKIDGLEEAILNLSSMRDMLTRQLNEAKKTWRKRVEKSSDEIAPELVNAFGRYMNAFRAIEDFFSENFKDESITKLAKATGATRLQVSQILKPRAISVLEPFHVLISEYYADKAENLKDEYTKISAEYMDSVSDLRTLVKASYYGKEAIVNRVYLNEEIFKNLEKVLEERGNSKAGSEPNPPSPTQPAQASGSAPQTTYRTR